MEEKYQYNGIELTNDFGLMIAEAQFRSLDLQLGRWWQIDPEVEQFEAWSAYNSNLDNPIRYQDRRGDSPSGGDPDDDFIQQPANIPEMTGGFGGIPGRTQRLYSKPTRYSTSGGKFRPYSSPVHTNSSTELKSKLRQIDNQKLAADKEYLKPMQKGKAVEKEISKTVFGKDYDNKNRVEQLQVRNSKSTTSSGHNTIDDVYNRYGKTNVNETKYIDDPDLDLSKVTNEGALGLLSPQQRATFDDWANGIPVTIRSTGVSNYRQGDFLTIDDYCITVTKTNCDGNLEYRIFSFTK